MTTADDMRRLIVAAGLSEQHKCKACKRLLLAFGRNADDAWSCRDCKVEGATIADFDNEPKS